MPLGPASPWRPAPSSPMTLLDALRLIWIVDAKSATDGDRLDAVLGAGVSALWLREPSATGAELFRLARDLKVRCDAHGAALIVGDRVDVALAVGAHGVQIGHRSPPAKHIRPLLKGWLGTSCHSPRDLARAAEAEADFAVLSPVFGVPERGPPLGTARLQALEAKARLPIVALGGIGRDNVRAVRDTGIDGIAVIRALKDADDPVTEAHRLARR